MQNEVIRKLDLIVRIEDTLADVTARAAARVNDAETKGHLRNVAEHHERHVMELTDAGFALSSSGKVDMEMDVYRNHIDAQDDEDGLLEALYNMEREQSARIEESLTEHLDRTVANLLDAIRDEIERDVRPIHEHAHGDGAKLQ